MQIELKKAIVEHVFNNVDDFGIINNTVDKFRAYIYDSEGEYLIGGREVSEFIKQAIDLVRGKA